MAPSLSVPLLPSSERREIRRYRVPLLSREMRQANGSFCVMPVFFSVQLLPPLFDFAQVFPPSLLMQTPPRYFPTPERRHIFGRGRSWVQLFTLQARPLTTGSKTIQ